MLRVCVWEGGGGFMFQGLGCGVHRWRGRLYTLAHSLALTDSEAGCISSLSRSLARTDGEAHGRDALADLGEDALDLLRLDLEHLRGQHALAVEDGDHLYEKNRAVRC